jgi:small subunit ribosomal protein S6
VADREPTYDLVVLLDLSATDDARAKIVADTRKAIEGQGTLIGHHPWGERQLAYEIVRREAAEYHLFQFHGPPNLLSSLERALRITDGVLRYRLIKLEPGTPPPPETPGVHASRQAAAPPASEARVEEPEQASV